MKPTTKQDRDMMIRALSLTFGDRFESLPTRQQIALTNDARDMWVEDMPNASAMDACRELSRRIGGSEALDRYVACLMVGN